VEAAAAAAGAGAAVVCAAEGGTFCGPLCNADFIFLMVSDDTK
jgi:hypothetical protein